VVLFFFVFFFLVLFRRNKVTYTVFRGFFSSFALPAWPRRTEDRPKGLRFMCRPLDLSETKNI